MRRAHCREATERRNRGWGSRLGRLGWVDLLHVALDVAQHVVGVQVVRQVGHHVEAVAHVDQRPARPTIINELTNTVALQCDKQRPSC